MEFEQYWQKALKSTEIIRTRIQGLSTFSDTHVPYILLSESSINAGDTVVRQGEVLVVKPSLFLPPNNPQFQGFEFEGQEVMSQHSFVNFLLVRGISLPSLQYNNKTSFLDVFEGDLSKAVKHYEKFLQQKENVQTGLVVWAEDCWQFSVLIFILAQVVRNANSDIKKLLEDYKKRNESNNG